MKYMCFKTVVESSRYEYLGVRQLCAGRLPSILHFEPSHKDSRNFHIASEQSKVLMKYYSYFPTACVSYHVPVVGKTFARIEKGAADAREQVEDDG